MLRNGQGADCGLDRVGKPDPKIWAFKGTACLVNQAVSSSSVREPSARWRKVKYFSSGGETTFKPFTRRKPSETTRAVRLFPSTKAWLRAMPRAYDAASRGRLTE